MLLVRLRLPYRAPLERCPAVAVGRFWAQQQQRQAHVSVVPDPGHAAGRCRAGQGGLPILPCPLSAPVVLKAGRGLRASHQQGREPRSPVWGQCVLGTSA
ncbi:hypothetical protein E2C01_017854 [Portunus trituberculatus]|uniref:Uncharacterized protein n=1 Tax=Portunus trituberculatus TaxID=210409 RepID=A0A5B7DTJ8_PORTR|nr:hypothetical protein [Portunus trituberculatus]